LDLSFDRLLMMIKFIGNTIINRKQNGGKMSTFSYVERTSDTRVRNVNRSRLLHKQSFTL